MHDDYTAGEKGQWMKVATAFWGEKAKKLGFECSFGVIFRSWLKVAM